MYLHVLSGGKTKAESNGDSAGPSKKARMSKVEYRWEYEGDKRTWTQYSDALNKVVTDAFEGKKAQVRPEFFLLVDLQTLLLQFSGK